MTKEKAAELLGYLVGMIEDNQENDYDTALKMAIDALNADRWTPVTEGAPKDYGPYLITVVERYWGGGESEPYDVIGIYNPYRKYKWGDHNGDVKAWMPLPEPWKGGAE